MEKITIANIAKMAGVSTTAVSFALNGKPGVSDNTRKRILDAAHRTGYFRTVPGRLGKYNTTIAVLIRNHFPVYDQLLYTEINSSVLRACDNQSINLMLISTYFKGNELVLSNNIHTGIFDGILVYGDVEPIIFAQLRKLNVPLVVLDSSRCTDDKCDYLAVHVDYEDAAYTITRHLIELGHTDIALIGNDKIRDFNLMVFKGFQRATMESNIQLKTNRIQLNVYDANSHIQCMQALLHDHNPPTAIVCASDFYAMRTMRRLHHKGLRVPQDISVVAIDDLITSRHLVPSLTTMHVDCDRIGQIGIDLMQRVINGESCDPVIMPKCKLIIRESAARLSP